MDASPLRRVVEWALIAVFLVAISLPMLGKLLPTEGAFALTENRRPASFPTIHFEGPGWHWSITGFPRRFERYWNDSFSFRWYLIRAHSISKLALGASPSPKVILGYSGFLYYGGERSVDYFRNTHPFTSHELTLARQELERRRQWLAERGVRHLVVVAPNKETIYPEYMPASLQPVRDESRLDQLLRELRERSSIDVLDLRPTLREARKLQRVYHTTDTHWNDAGAIAASRAILDKLAEWFPQLDTTQFSGSLVTRTGPGGDLARVLALEDRFPEEYVEWKPAGPTRSAVVNRPSGGSQDPTVHACPACTGPVVVMTEDSFNENLAPLLAEHFRTLVRVDGFRLAQPVVTKYKPEIVIEQFVERKLMCWQGNC